MLSGIVKMLLQLLARNVSWLDRASLRKLHNSKNYETLHSEMLVLQKNIHNQECMRTEEDF
jgi:hypothetical protein